MWKWRSVACVWNQALLCSGSIVVFLFPHEDRSLYSTIAAPCYRPLLPRAHCPFQMVVL